MNSSIATTRFWAVVPAAGVGARMGAGQPKQYLRIHHKTILEHTLELLLRLPGLQGLVVLVSPDDDGWRDLPVFSQPRIEVAEGGAERSDSVLNGLRLLRQRLQPSDWVLVHDAARPCVTIDDIENLVAAVAGHPVGGILGAPVSDTLKRADADRGIRETVDRSALWRALTPQLFRFAPLLQALQDALERGLVITDEASALEAAGLTPLMVEGRSDNIKITRPEDLLLAELLLRQPERR
ncbi:MAG: 2-C-methyl-D-erythritol 4-phosphate cytidylyltransferase [Gammaproteobacteria bacterium]|nr:2-C-methyl-D-erythritol 4-phosphate cytidylyltransferase [Gammaproteobacteria bacterium]